MSALLHVRDLNVTVGGLRGRREVLHGIDLQVQCGEWVALIGPNGSGKSTLLCALTGLVPHTGTVTVNAGAHGGEGGSARPLRPTDAALMPQSPVLPPGMTVAEYVLLGRTPHLGWLGRESRADHRIVAAVLRRLSLAEYADREVSQLSGGEGQRVAIARALAQQAPIVLLDEPTSALDVGTQAAVLDLVQTLRHTEGLTVIAALHDLGAAATYADRLVLLDQGHVAACDVPGKVLEPELLSRVYGADLQVRELDGELLVLPRRRPR